MKSLFYLDTIIKDLKEVIRKRHLTVIDPNDKNKFDILKDFIELKVPHWKTYIKNILNSLLLEKKRKEINLKLKELQKDIKPADIEFDTQIKKNKFQLKVDLLCSYIEYFLISPNEIFLVSRFRSKIKIQKQDLIKNEKKVKELSCRPYYIGWLSGPEYMVYVEEDRLRIYDRNLSTTRYVNFKIFGQF